MALRQEKVSERLLELRERQGLSQEDAARKVGITHRQWQRWESGQSMPYPRSLDSVASAFGISITEFFDPEQPVVVDESQLDRIEAKLDELLTLFGDDGELGALAGQLRALGDPDAGAAGGQVRSTGSAKRKRRAG